MNKPASLKKCQKDLNVTEEAKFKSILKMLGTV